MRFLRSMPSLQRRFAVVVLSSLLVFLLYMLLTTSSRLDHSQGDRLPRTRPEWSSQAARDGSAGRPPIEHPPGTLAGEVKDGRDAGPIAGRITTKPVAPGDGVEAPPGKMGAVDTPPARDANANVEAPQDGGRPPPMLPREPDESDNTGDKAAAPSVVMATGTTKQADYGDDVIELLDTLIGQDKQPAGIPGGEPGPLSPAAQGGPGARVPPQPRDDPYAGPTNERQEAVVEAFMHAWSAYKKYAWGHDELKPVSKGWQEWMGVGLTIVDSLDTMYIMGLKDEFALGREWVANELNFDRDTDVQLFEIVIRELGGLLSAYHLSGDHLFLEKALVLGTRLNPCFTGPTKVPCNRINMKRGKPSFIEISTAEVGTIQLEFRDLARSSGQNLFEKAMDDISDHLHKMEKMDGLVSCFINPHTGMFRMASTVSVGASADSYYEYLIKQWIQTGKQKDWLKNDYLDAVEGIWKHLYRFTEPGHLAFVGSYNSARSKSFRTDMEHLACFLPGTLALGYMAGLGNQHHLKMAENLTRTCYEMYRRMPTGLSPEVAHMNIQNTGTEDISTGYSSVFNLQRPETVESIFYLYRATGDPQYREWGWQIFQAFEKHTRLADGGYASIDSVKRPDNPGHRDKMETFYLAETLKYLYLLFSDDPNLIPLDKFVINTEAHPLPVYTS